MLRTGARAARLRDKQCEVPKRSIGIIALIRALSIAGSARNPVAAGSQATAIERFIYKQARPRSSKGGAEFTTSTDDDYWDERTAVVSLSPPRGCH